jgi:hypothetical protein
VVATSKGRLKSGNAKTDRLVIAFLRCVKASSARELHSSVEAVSKSVNGLCRVNFSVEASSAKTMQLWHSFEQIFDRNR